jgi:hypothetical protein
MGGRTPLTEANLHHDIDVSWWVTPDAYERGFLPQGPPRAAALGGRRDSRSGRPYFSNAEIPGAVMN